MTDALTAWADKIHTARCPAPPACAGPACPGHPDQREREAFSAGAQAPGRQVLVVAGSAVPGPPPHLAGEWAHLGPAERADVLAWAASAADPGRVDGADVVLVGVPACARWGMREPWGPVFGREHDGAPRYTEDAVRARAAERLDDPTVVRRYVTVWEPA